MCKQRIVYIVYFVYSHFLTDFFIFFTEKIFLYKNKIVLLQYNLKQNIKMEAFDINKVIEHYKLDEKEVAEALFPHVRYKDLALKRVLKGEAFLSSEQLSALANLAGVLVYDLFYLNNSGWKGQREDGCIVLIKDDWKVKLNYNGIFLTVYKGQKVVKQEITNNANYSLDAFIKYIDNIISNLKTN